MHIVNPEKNKSYVTKMGIIAPGKEIRREWVNGFDKMLENNDIIEVKEEVKIEEKPIIVDVYPEGKEKKEEPQNIETKKRGRKPNVVGGAVKIE